MDKVQELWPAAVVTVVDETVAALAGAGLAPEPAAGVVVRQDGVFASVAVVAGREVIAGGLVAGGPRGPAQAVVEHLRVEHRLDASMEQRGPRSFTAACSHHRQRRPAAGPFAGR